MVVVVVACNRSSSRSRNAVLAATGMAVAVEAAVAAKTATLAESCSSLN